MDIAIIREVVRSGDYHFTLHAVRQMAERGIFKHEGEEAILRGEVIEEYPRHHYGPCCLIYGHTQKGRHLHVVTSLEPVWVITAYEPDLQEWIDHRVRR